MKPKYIDANQIQWHSNWLISGDKRIFAYQDEVDNIPIADVEEVRHGKWMDGKYFPFIPKKETQGFQTATCSRCNITQSVNTYQEKVMFNYCPYCGAKMDGKEK